MLRTLLVKKNGLARLSDFDLPAEEDEEKGVAWKARRFEKLVFKCRQTRTETKTNSKHMKDACFVKGANALEDVALASRSKVLVKLFLWGMVAGRGRG